MFFTHLLTGNTECLVNTILQSLINLAASLAVIDECVEEARNKGYVLTVNDVTVYEERPSKLLLLNYEIKIPIYNILGREDSKEAVIEGYAI